MKPRRLAVKIDAHIRRGASVDGLTSDDLFHAASRVEGTRKMMLDTPVIRQRLFSAKAPDGSSLCLAFLLDGGCAILRDEQVIEVFDDSERAIDRALEHFLAIAKVTHGQ